MGNVSVAMVTQHLLFLFLLVVSPLWDLYDMRKLERNPSSELKLRYYRTLCTWLWVAGALAVGALGFRSLFVISPSPGEIPWLLLHPWVHYLVEALIAIFAVLTVVLPVGIVAWKKLTRRPRRYSSAALESFSYFFPATWTERRWWVLVSITAGVCEEVLFRGFLLHYLHVSPWTLNLTLALLISSLIFGFNHFYQGAGGAAGVALGGGIFGLLFLLTGNLLFPILFHGATDLRVLTLLRPPAGPQSGEEKRAGVQ